MITTSLSTYEQAELAHTIMIPNDPRDFTETCIENKRKPRKVLLHAAQSRSGKVEPGVEVMVVPCRHDGTFGYAYTTMHEAAVNDRAVKTWTVCGTDIKGSARQDKNDFCKDRTSFPDLKTATYAAILRDILRYLAVPGISDVLIVGNDAPGIWDQQRFGFEDFYYKDGTELFPGASILGDLVHFGCQEGMDKLIALFKTEGQKEEPAHVFWESDLQPGAGTKIQSLIRCLEHLLMVIKMTFPPGQVADYYGANIVGQTPHLYFTPTPNDTDIKIMKEATDFLIHGNVHMPTEAVVDKWHAMLLMNVHPYIDLMMEVWYRYPYALPFFPTGFYYYAGFATNFALLTEMTYGHMDAMFPVKRQRYLRRKSDYTWRKEGGRTLSFPAQVIELEVKVCDDAASVGPNCNPPTWPLTRQQVRQNIRQIGQFIDMNVMVHDMGVDDQLLTNVVQMPVPRISLNRDVYTELLMIESNFGDALLRQNTNGFRELAQAAVSAIVEHARGKDLPDLYLNELAKDGSLFCVPYIDNMPQMAFLGKCCLVLATSGVSRIGKIRVSAAHETRKLLVRVRCLQTRDSRG